MLYGEYWYVGNAIYSTVDSNELTSIAMSLTILVNSNIACLISKKKQKKHKRYESICVNWIANAT